MTTKHIKDSTQPKARMLDRIQSQLRGEIDAPPIAKLIGFELTAISEGRAVVEFQAGSQHANSMGTLHGGILCDIADAAMGLAYASNLAEGETFTTLELKINFLKPAWNATLTAEGKVLKQGRTIGLTECSIRDEKGTLIAHATSTCMTLRGAEAEGR